MYSAILAFSLYVDSVKEVRVVIEDDDSEKPKTPKEKSLQHKRNFYKWKSFPNTNKSDKGSRTKKWNRDIYCDILEVEQPLPKPDEEEAIGIITLEDVIEELLQVTKYYTLLSPILVINWFSELDRRIWH